MKILITGGSGYLARNLKPLFENKGYEVLAPSRTELDLLNFGLLDEYMQKNKPDAIIHTAIKGGERGKPDTFEDVFIPNIRMFENLMDVKWWETVPTIIIGSGAELDRRWAIREDNENALFNRWPMDPYGLSKNIIARRSLTEYKHIYILRLFGCFNHDEDTSRFIKAGILNAKRGLPIEVHQDMKMDFFYLDDVFTTIDYILHNSDGHIPKNLNLVYEWKINLIGIAGLIQNLMESSNPRIKISNISTGKDYTGSGYFLKRMQIGPTLKLIGLEEGIRRTINKLT